MFGHPSSFFFLSHASQYKRLPTTANEANASTVLTSTVGQWSAYLKRAKDAPSHQQTFIINNNFRYCRFIYQPY